MTKQVKIPISFNLFKIRDEEFYIKEISDEIKLNFNAELLKLAYNWGFEISPDSNVFVFRLGIKYFYELEGQEIEILKYVAAFSFKVKNFNDLIMVPTDNKDFQINDDLFASFFGVAFSTMRGCIFQKTKNNFINEYFLPVINPYKFLRQYIPGFGTEDEMNQEL